MKTPEDNSWRMFRPAANRSCSYERKKNPVLLDGNPSFEVTVSYGQHFLRGALFVNLPDTELIFKLTARKDDFQELSCVRISISSWHWSQGTIVRRLCETVREHLEAPDTDALQ